MARPKKDGKHISFYANKGIVEMLDRYAEDKGQTKTTALERILEEHITNYFSNQKYIRKNKENK
jgi:hypothetical protein